jgi:hypothetical protein
MFNPLCLSTNIHGALTGQYVNMIAPTFVGHPQPVCISFTPIELHDVCTEAQTMGEFSDTPDSPTHRLPFASLALMHNKRVVYNHTSTRQVFEAHKERKELRPLVADDLNTKWRSGRGRNIIKYDSAEPRIYEFDDDEEANTIELDLEREPLNTILDSLLATLDFEVNHSDDVNHGDNVDLEPPQRSTKRKRQASPAPPNSQTQASFPTTSFAPPNPYSILVVESPSPAAPRRDRKRKIFRPSVDLCVPTPNCTNSTTPQDVQGIVKGVVPAEFADGFVK